MEEYTLEHLNLDLRKANLFVENAIAAFNITVDETALCESADESELILTEAGDGLGLKIRMAIQKIIESVKKFFNNLIAKIKSIFTKSNEDSVKRALKENPDVGKIKIDIENPKEIEALCGKRFILRAKVMKKYKAGTLTEEEFEKMVEEHDALGKKMGVVGIITVSVLAAAGLVFGGMHILKKTKNEGDSTVGELKGVAKIKAAMSSMATKVSSFFARGASEDSKQEGTTKVNIFKRIANAVKGGLKSMKSKVGSLLHKNKSISDTPIVGDDVIDVEVEESVYDDFDPTDTFFDI